MTRDVHAMDLRFVDGCVGFFLRVGRRDLDVVEAGLVHLAHGFAEAVRAAREVGPLRAMAAGRRDQLPNRMQPQRVDIAETLRRLQRLHRLDHAGDVASRRHARVDVHVHEMQSAQRREAIRRVGRTVARIDEMHVHVDESRQHVLARRVVTLRVGGNLDRARGPDRDDAIVADEDGRVRDRLAAVAVDQRAAGDRDGRSREGPARAEAARASEQQQASQWHFHDDGPLKLLSGTHSWRPPPCGIRPAAIATSRLSLACRTTRLRRHERACRRTTSPSSRRTNTRPSAPGSAR